MSVITNFGEDLAFAGIDNVELVGVVNANGSISVHIAHNGASGIVGGFQSIAQAEAAISIAHQACANYDLVDEAHRADLAISLLSLLANKSYIFPTEDDFADDEGWDSVAFDQAEDSYRDFTRGL